MAVLIQLKAFLRAHNQINWGAYDGWPEASPSPCGSWQGVGCDADGLVSSLDFSSSSISGPLFGNANATRSRHRSRSSSFLATISLHLRALSLAPVAAPPRCAVAGNPHSVSLTASSSPAPGGAGARKRTAADSARRLTAAISISGSAARMDRTHAAQPPHIMPLTSSSVVVAPAVPSPAVASSTDDGSVVAWGRSAGAPWVGRWRGAVGWRRLGFGLA
jgi:hypothetical protein